MSGMATGIDIVDVARIRRAAARWKNSFLQRVFTEKELRYAGEGPASAPRLAARFAAKEAVLKALGTGLSGGMTWHDIEVWNEPSGRPRVRLRGEAARRSRTLGVRQIEISLSHIPAYAVAHAVLVLGEAPRENASARRPSGRGQKPKATPAPA